MKSRYADLILVLITAVWGLSFPIMRNSLAYIPEMTYLCYRFSLASLVLLVFFRKRYRKVTKKLLCKGLILGCALFGALSFTVFALQYTSASNVAFITGLNIVIVPLCTGLVFKRKIDRNRKIAVAASVAGLLLISGGVNLNFNIGDGLALLCALCVSAQIILTDLFTGQEDSVLLGTLQINFATVIYLLVCFFGGAGFAFEVQGIVIVTILVTGVLGTALAFVGQTYVQKYTEPDHVALIFILEPVFGAVFALIIPNLDGTYETMSLVKGAGCALLLASMIFAELSAGNGKSQK